MDCTLSMVMEKHTTIVNAETITSAMRSSTSVSDTAAFLNLPADYTANICAASEKFFTPATVPCRFAQLSRLKLTVRRISPNTPAAVTPAPAP